MDHKIASVVRHDQVGKYLVPGLLTHGHKKAVNLQLLLCPPLPVSQPQAGQLPVGL